MPKDEMATSFTESNIPYVIASSLTISLIFIEIALYIFKFHPSAPIVGILMLLIINDFLLSLFEIPTFLGSMPNGLCLAGIIGTTFFRLAASKHKVNKIIG